MSEFVNYLSDVFEQFGLISSRKMFGGYGIYYEGLMFALVADDELFLKVDEKTREEFEKNGLEPFEYVKNNKPMKMSYHRAPEIIFDDKEIAVIWANKAFEAALRANAKKRRRNDKTL